MLLLFSLQIVVCYARNYIVVNLSLQIFFLLIQMKQQQQQFQHGFNRKRFKNLICLNIPSYQKQKQQQHFIPSSISKISLHT